MDLSSPQGQSINDGIEPELCSLEYLRLDKVTNHIAGNGRGSLLAKWKLLVPTKWKMCRTNHILGILGI